MLVVSKPRQQTVEEYLNYVRRHGTQNSRDDYGIPTLCSAIEKFRSPYLVKALLKDGVDVNTFSCSYRLALSHRSSVCGRCIRWWGNFSPIHLAVSLGLHEVVKLLWEHGADLKSKTTKGIEPVDFLFNDIYSVRSLENCDVRVSEADDYEILKLMYAAGVDLNTKDKCFRQSTLLHRVTKLNNEEITRYLINLGCDVNCVDSNDKTPLRHCVVDALECARILLQNNANPNSRDNFGNTIYHDMMSYRYFGNSNCPLHFLRLLHDFNVDPNARNDVGQTALHVYFDIYMIPGVRTEKMIDTMLKYGADPNITDELDRLPIYYLIGYSHKTLDAWNIVWSLLIKTLDYGANLNKVDIIGKPLLHELVESCLSCPKYFDSKLFKEVFRSRYNVEVNCQDLHSRTALHLVSAKGNWTMAEILINYGADIKTEDCDGNTPLDVAILCKQWAFARKLLLMPLSPCTIVDYTLRNEHANSSEGNPSALSQFTQICRNNNQQDHINHIFQKKNNSFLHCSTEEIRQNTKGRLDKFRRTMSLANTCMQQDRACFNSGRQCAEWTPNKLDIIAKHVEQDKVLFLDRVKAEMSFCGSTVCPVPTIHGNIFKEINKSSLLEMCEENSVGEFHIIEECGEEHCLIAKQVFRLMTDLVQKCSEIDPRLESNILWAGSSAEGTKMWLPNEFDFLMELVGLRGKCEFNDPMWTTAKLLVKEGYQESWSNFCVEDSDILSNVKLKKYISTLLWKAACLLDRKKYKNVRFRLCKYDKNLHTFIKTTKVGVNITVCWCGEKYKNLIISIDLTPAISVTLAEKQFSRIHKHGVRRLVDNNIHVIPYVKHGEHELEWRPSFSLTEVHIMKKLSRKQIGLYKGLKFFRDIHESMFAAIPSYYLKTFFFNYIFLDSSGRDTFLVERENFHSSLCRILYHLNLVACSLHADGNIQHFFLNYHLYLSDYDMRWIKSTLNILENC